MRNKRRASLEKEREHGLTHWRRLEHIHPRESRGRWLWRIIDVVVEDKHWNRPLNENEARGEA